LQWEVVASLDSVTHVSFALTCPSFYRKYFPHNSKLFGIAFPIECARGGFAELLRYSRDVLCCPWSLEAIVLYLVQTPANINFATFQVLWESYVSQKQLITGELTNRNNDIVKTKVFFLLTYAAGRSALEDFPSIITLLDSYLTNFTIEVTSSTCIVFFEFLLVNGCLDLIKFIDGHLDGLSERFRTVWRSIIEKEKSKLSPNEMIFLSDDLEFMRGYMEYIHGHKFEEKQLLSSCLSCFPEFFSGPVLALKMVEFVAAEKPVAYKSPSNLMMQVIASIMDPYLTIKGLRLRLRAHQRTQVLAVLFNNLGLFTIIDFEQTVRISYFQAITQAVLDSDIEWIRSLVPPLSRVCDHVAVCRILTQSIDSTLGLRGGLLNIHSESRPQFGEMIKYFLDLFDGGLKNYILPPNPDSTVSFRLLFVYSNVDLFLEASSKYQLSPDLLDDCLRYLLSKWSMISKGLAPAATNIDFDVWNAILTAGYRVQRPDDLERELIRDIRKIPDKCFLVFAVMQLVASSDSVDIMRNVAILDAMFSKATLIRLFGKLFQQSAAVSGITVLLLHRFSMLPLPHRLMLRNLDAILTWYEVKWAKGFWSAPLMPLERLEVLHWRGREIAAILKKHTL